MPTWYLPMEQILKGFWDASFRQAAVPPKSSNLLRASSYCATRMMMTMITPTISTITTTITIKIISMMTSMAGTQTITITMTRMLAATITVTANMTRMHGSPCQTLEFMSTISPRHFAALIQGAALAIGRMQNRMM